VKFAELCKVWQILMKDLECIWKENCIKAIKRLEKNCKNLKERKSKISKMDMIDKIFKKIH
jgi:hypothetical protein